MKTLLKSNLINLHILKINKILLFFVLICMIIFSFFYYNFFYLGNNISRNQDEVVEKVLKQFNSYEANIDVTVKSNKNENNYNISQSVENNNSKLIINSPESIKDISIEFKENELKLTNVQLGFEKTYDNYKGILNNSLFLDVFEKDYQENNAKIYEENDEIIIEIELTNNPNTYVKYKYLHLDKKTELPKKLIIKDITKNTYISIIYNDIKIK